MLRLCRLISASSIIMQSAANQHINLSWSPCLLRYTTSASAACLLAVLQWQLQTFVAVSTRWFGVLSDAKWVFVLATKWTSSNPGFHRIAQGAISSRTSNLWGCPWAVGYRRLSSEAFKLPSWSNDNKATLAQSHPFSSFLNSPAVMFALAGRTIKY